MEPNQTAEPYCDPFSPPVIEVQGLHKSYGDRVVLEGIDFQVRSGETLAIIGPSGSGKSSILKILSGLLPYDSGRVNISQKRLGMVFQYSALLNSYTVGENLYLALHHCRMSEKRKWDLIRDKLRVVGLEEFIGAMPDNLSGGQQKRVSFARAIVNNPDVILYDEPTAGLDPISSTLLENYMNRLSQQECMAGIVVTHQQSTIRRTASRVMCLFEGNSVWQGSSEDLDTDANPYIRQFMDGSVSGPFAKHL